MVLLLELRRRDVADRPIRDSARAVSDRFATTRVRTKKTSPPRPRTCPHCLAATRASPILPRTRQRGPRYSQPSRSEPVKPNETVVSGF